MALFPLIYRDFQFADHSFGNKKGPQRRPFQMVQGTYPNRSIPAALLFAIKTARINQPTTRTGNVVRQRENHRFADHKNRQESHTDLVE